MKSFISILLVCVFSVTGIVGCGGGGGESAPIVTTAEAAGVWMGSVTESGGTTFSSVGLLSTDGQLQFVVEDPAFICDGTQYSGTFSMNGNVGSGSVTGYAAAGCTFTDGSTVSPGTINFTISGNSLTGSYSTPGDTGTFSFGYDAIAENPVTLADIQGNWGYNLSPTMFSNFTFAADGSLTGTDDTGCVFAGQTSVIDPNWSITDISINVTSCADTSTNGSYSGLGLLQFDAAGDSLVFLVSNATLAGSDVLDRLP